MLDRAVLPVTLALLIGLPAIPVASVAQVPDSVRGWPILAGVVVVEAAAFGSGLLARSESGARLAGGIHAVSGITALSVALLDSRSGLPELMVPYGIGLLSLSWYNFSTATSASRQERFWTNAIGLNAVVLISCLSVIVLDGDGYGPGAVALRARPGGLQATISF